MPVDVVSLLREHRPLFHAGGVVSWGAQAGVLDFLAMNVVAGMRTLETGCGYSTCVFAGAGARHLCVTPAADEADSVREFLDRSGVPRDGLEFAIGHSERLLPTRVDDGPLDLVYIDGAHRFPLPAVDFVYTEPRLAVGGLLLIDDVRIPSVRSLHDFIAGERAWRLEWWIGDTSVFRKVADVDRSRDWDGQAYNDRYPDYSFMPLPRRAAVYARKLAEKLGRGR